MKIGIIGAGKIGATVGRLWHQAGHRLYFGTRHPQELGALAEELGGQAGTPEDAAAFGDAVLLAVPLDAVPDLGPRLVKAVAGKPVLDATNAFAQRDGELARAATRHPAGSSGWVASHFPGARVVKAFNTVNYKVLESGAHLGADGPGIPLASDDPKALALAEQLVRDAGFIPVTVGTLSDGKRLEPGSPVFNSGMRAADLAGVLRASVTTGT